MLSQRFPTQNMKKSARFRQLILLFVFFVLPPVLINGFAYLQPWADPVDLYRDPLLVADIKFKRLRNPDNNSYIHCCQYWLGAVSNIGILVWAGTAGALFIAFSANLLRAGNTRVRNFLLIAFLLTTLLAVDDMFQFHEQEKLLGDLKGEVFLYPLFIALMFLYGYYREIARTAYVAVLLLAGGLFGLSLLADQLMAQGGYTVLLEDSVKLLGIFLWSAYHLMIAVETVIEQRVFFLPENASRAL